MKKPLANWIKNIMTAVIAIILILYTFSIIQSRLFSGQVPSVFGFRTMTVLTGSMRPGIQPGDMILSRSVNSNKLEAGDVVTYRKGSSFVTHRVVEVVSSEGSLQFRTKGDANNADDQELISADRIIGRMLFKVPMGGYAAKFIRSPIGFVIFFIVPILLVIAFELKSILSERKDSRGKSEAADNVLLK